MSTIITRLQNKQFREHVLTEKPHSSFSNKENTYLNRYKRFLKSKNGSYVLEAK